MPLKRLGIDFDNTIVCYDALAVKLCSERGFDCTGLESKEQIRNFLRNLDKEDIWTSLQAELYGQRIIEAAPFPGVIDCLKSFCDQGIQVCIISHKTKYPYSGGNLDLHRAAWEWLENSSILSFLKKSEIFFEVSKEAKLKRIETLPCDAFVDDLEELLLDPNFPLHTEKILFDPRFSYNKGKLKRFSEWAMLKGALK